MKFIKLIKASLTEEEINQIKTKFDKTNWSDAEIYDPGNGNDNYDTWESLKDTIISDYLTEEQENKIDEKDFEKIIGLTFEQFSKNRDLYEQKHKLENDIEKYHDDYYELKRLTEDGIGKLNFDYEFIDTLYSEKNRLETKVNEMKEQIKQLDKAIKQTLPKFKTWKEVSDQRTQEALEYLNKRK